MGFLPWDTVLHKFAHCDPPHRLQFLWAASAWVPSRGCGKTSVPVPGALPSPPLLILESTGLFLSHLPFSLVCLLLKVISQRCHHHHWWAWPWPALGPSCSWLGLTLLDPGEASCSLSQKPPYSIPAVKSLATQTQYSCEEQMCSGKYDFRFMSRQQLGRS